MRTFPFTLVCHTKPTLGSTGSANYDRVFFLFVFFFGLGKANQVLFPHRTFTKQWQQHQSLEYKQQAIFRGSVAIHSNQSINLNLF